MYKKVILEFFPELELIKKNGKKSSQILMTQVVQSKRSIRLYSQVRSQKFQSNFRSRLLESKNHIGTHHHIILIKKYSGYKQYRSRKKPSPWLLPAITLRSGLICEGRLPRKKELDLTMDNKRFQKEY